MLSRRLFLQRVFLPVAALAAGCGKGKRDNHDSRRETMDKLSQIAYGLRRYHETYGHFPPAYSVDEEGRPLLSWRVLLLPFLDYAPLYRKFDLKKPWDDPHNLELLKFMPPFYRSSLAEEKSETTSYAGVFGPGCMFEGSEPVKLSDVTDEIDKTLMVGEVKGAGIPWTKPQDIDIQAHPQLGDPQGFSGYHEGQVYFSTADSNLMWLLLNKPNAEQLQRLFLRNDGKPIDF
ncbi:MAG: DUF1559 domain-containing protein [Planctomycetes bacterium]|nr:DUF1559 domain-containing protein [Planctomycetota bacterium]